MKKLFLAISLLIISISFTLISCGHNVNHQMDDYCLEQCWDRFQFLDIYSAVWQGNDYEMGITRCECRYDDWYRIIYVDLKEY